MEISKRLKILAEQLYGAKSFIDVGTDHGYVPIYAVKNNIVEKAIASDINKGPTEKAKMNISFEGLSSKIDVRLGAGLSTIRENEVEVALMAGMGGNLIRDIILNDISKVKRFKFMVLQAPQNPEVLREFLYKGKFDILEEDVCFDEGIYYEIFKVKYNESANKINVNNKIEYEVSNILLEKRTETIENYIKYKIDKYENILGFIKDNSESAIKRKYELEEKINLLKEMIKC